MSSKTGCGAIGSAVDCSLDAHLGSHLSVPGSSPGSRNSFALLASRHLHGQKFACSLSKHMQAWERDLFVIIVLVWLPSNHLGPKELFEPEPVPKMLFA